MRKIVLLLLAICFTGVVSAQNSNTELLRQGVSKRKAKAEANAKIDKKEFWIGKVPVKNGKATFEKAITASGKSQAQIFDAMSTFAQKLVENTGHPTVSQITIQEKEQGKIIGILQETMYFKRSKWQTDFTEFYYQLTIDCSSETCKITISDIQYRYEEERDIPGEYLKAEDWITDDAAFNKSKTKLLKEPGKFRRATIKRINEIFETAEKFIK